MDIERELSKMDFSGKSKIKESLRGRLLSELRASRELSLDELDGVVAAAGHARLTNNQPDELGKKRI